MPRKAAKGKQPDDSEWRIDDGVWLEFLGPLLRNHDGQAELGARIFHRLFTEFEKPEGAHRVMIALEDARRVCFPFTKFASDCEILFRESLDKPESITLAGLLGRKRSRSN